MSDLSDALGRSLDGGAIAGAIGLIAQGDDTEVVVLGLADVESGRPMTRDTIVRVSSMTKTVTAVVTATLIEDGLLRVDDPVARWIPELEAPTVVRTPGGPLDDVVPADRHVTVRDLLTSTSGWGFASDFAAPAVAELGRLLRPSGPLPASIPAADEYVATLARTPMAYQPGQAFVYDISLDLLGILLERASGVALPDLFAERLFARLGMTDTGFFVPSDGGTGSRACTTATPAADSPSSTRRTGSGASHRPSLQARAGSSRPPKTGWPCAGCCSGGAPWTARGCSPPRRSTS